MRLDFRANRWQFCVVSENHVTADWADLPYRVCGGNFLAVTSRWPAASVEIVCGDPPYSEHTHGGMRGNRGKNIVGQKKIVKRQPGFEALTVDQINTYAKELCRIGSQWIVLFSDDISLHYWRVAITEAGGRYLRTIPWCRWSSPNFSGKCPPCGAEFIIIARPKSIVGGPHRRNWLNGSRTHYDTKCLRAKSREKTSLAHWSPDEDYPGHRAQKPEGLMGEILGDCSLPGDTILDPFAGSGTTGIAALRRGNRVVLVDQEPANAAMCKGRMDREWWRLHG